MKKLLQLIGMSGKELPTFDELERYSTFFYCFVLTALRIMDKVSPGRFSRRTMWWVAFWFFWTQWNISFQRRAYERRLREKEHRNEL